MDPILISFQGNLRSYADIAGILRAVGTVDSTAISSVTASAHRINQDQPIPVHG